MLKELILLSLSINVAHSAYCGVGSIPTGLEVTPQGELVLECARSPCVGISPTQEEALQGFNFAGDGFVRDTAHLAQPNPLNAQVDCETSFTTNACGANQWVGGFAPGAGSGGQAFGLACCNYSPLQYSQSVGIAMIGNGQIFHGGDSFGQTGLPSYDYISNIQPNINPDGSVTYHTYIKRLTCINPLQAPIGPAFQAAPLLQQAAVPAAPAQGYYPVNGGSYYCFSGDSTILLASGKKKAMKDLKLDEWIHAYEDGNPVISKVDSWIHRKTSEEADFLHIKLEDEKSIKITKNHLIYKSSCEEDNNTEKKVVYAEELSVGDCLFVENEKTLTVSYSKIKSINTVTEVGYYSPHTGTGNMFVDGIFVSCYSNVDNEEIHNGYSKLKDFMSCDWMKNMFGYTKFFETEEDEVELVPGTNTLMLLTQYAFGYYK